METAENGIIDRILNDTREEAKTIVKNAQKYVETTIEERRLSARRNADKEVNSLLKKAKNEANIIGEKVYTDVKRQAGWTVLSEKNRLITTVLDEVKNRLLNIQKNSKEYRKSLERLIVDAGTVLGGGALEILVNEKDSRLSLRLDDLEKEISDKTGVNTQLKVSDERITAVGVIVKTADDQIFVDNTFEAILSRREKELKLKTARILFSRVSAS